MVRIYEKYVNLLLKESKHSALYKYSASKRQMSPSQWFADKPVGINSIKKVVKQLTEAAGLNGKYSNHSLRVTCAMRIFAAGVEEQVIKNLTGHKSDAICNYKRVNEDILKSANKTVSVEKPAESVSEPQETTSKSEQVFDIDDIPVGQRFMPDMVNMSVPKLHAHKKTL